MFVLENRVLVAHTYSYYAEDDSQGRLVTPAGFTQILKVIPLKWFYGGKEPAENPNLKNPFAPAKP